ncbi:transcription antitermination factor NusB [Rhizosaccharibacter radicis]|uniref:Transcription antitermination protein NusB n=1 Tax=Rhizosaccharibacter radicis TaxID=2782605 RepID=A0ABT1VY18_9PROT|nr:transcription antitermination factor NusB [Acetobacteraceae bacterium KSS12]
MARAGHRRDVPRGRPRTASRVAAVQALFQSEQGGETAETVIDQFLRHRLGDLPGTAGHDGGFEEGRVPDADVPMFDRLVRLAVREQDRVDGLLAEALPADWPLARLDPVLRALLRAGVAELLMENGPPPRVVINEYLDVAHGFFSGEEPRMVNGLLDALSRRLHAREFAGDAADRSHGPGAAEE